MAVETGWGALVSSVGLPTAMLIIFVICIIKEYLISGATHRRELADKDKSCDQALATKDDIIKDLRGQRNMLIQIASVQSVTAKTLLPVIEQTVSKDSI